VAFVLVFLSLAVISPGFASDWPQYRGANHDGISTDAIETSWADLDLNARLRWRVPCTNGLSSFSVAGGRAYTLIRRSTPSGKREVCVALDIKTGAEVWATVMGSGSYDGSVGADDGPRTTPSVADGRVIALSSFLQLSCLAVSNGATLWSKDLRSVYGGQLIGWQNGASPLVEDGKIILNINSSSQSLMALYATNGEVAWRSQSEAMTHSTPVLARLGDVPQAIFAAQTGLVSVHRDTGALLWKARYPFKYDTSLAASPVVWSNIVFISANYSMGSFATRVELRNGSWSTTPIWTNSSYKAHWMTPVCHDGYLYGMFGSSSSSSLKCIDILTGKQKWSMSGFGRGGTILVDSHVLCLSETGALVLIEPNPSAYTEIGRWQAFENYDPDYNKCWNVPTVSEGVVYARSTAEAICLDIAKARLKLLPPVFTGESIDLAVTTSTGAPLDATRLAKIHLRFTEDISVPIANWAEVQGGLTLDNGVARISGLNLGERQRFYIVSEAP
jgi:outer membrane protein assembly factor BamB